MGFTVFYAWQSDRHPKANRYLIRDAIEAAIGVIAADASIDDAPELDHDTKNVPGTPNIAETISKKISACGVFIADLTFVGKTSVTDAVKDKLLPNPNVLIELGIAAATVSWDRIILVMNTAFGPPEALPFDLRYRSFPLQYELQTPGPEAKQVRTKLEQAIEQKLRLIMQSNVLHHVKEEEGRKVILNSTIGLVGPDADLKPAIILEVVNDGTRPVVITSLGIETDDGRFLQPTPQVAQLIGLPKRLLDGDKVSTWFDLSGLQESFHNAQVNGTSWRLANAYANDSTGNKYTAPIPSSLQDVVEKRS